MPDPAKPSEPSEPSEPPDREPGAPPRGSTGGAPAGLPPTLSTLSGLSGRRFDKFTERAKRVLVLAQEEGRRLNHNYIGTEHLLLGLLSEGESIAAQVLRELDVELGKARGAVEHIIGRGDRLVVGDVSLAPRVKRVIELAVTEAKRLGHTHVGTEHLLLGLVIEGEGIAAGVLERMGVGLAKVRAQVLEAVVSPEGRSAEPAPATRNNVLTCRMDDADLAVDRHAPRGGGAHHPQRGRLVADPRRHPGQPRPLRAGREHGGGDPPAARPGPVPGPAGHGRLVRRRGRRAGGRGGAGPVRQFLIDPRSLPWSLRRALGGVRSVAGWRAAGDERRAVPGVGDRHRGEGWAAERVVRGIVAVPHVDLAGSGAAGQL